MRGIKKVYRFWSIYGFSRTIIKVAGRARNKHLRVFFPRLFFRRRSKGFISLIGCGQFGFSTISYFLYKNKNSAFLECYDIKDVNMLTTSNFWGYKANDVDSLITNPSCELVYIASNHATHTSYAIRSLIAGKDVYVEKPLSTNWNQFALVLEEVSKNNNNLFVGYNRPFSKAISIVSEEIKNNHQPLSLSCFVSGHVIEKEHWYRNEEEGTRIAGNVGHWIDLMVNLLNTKGQVPNQYKICLNTANKQEPDDNIAISISTNNHDIINIFITSRSEPFEGINESIDFQCGDVIVKIDDFRSMKMWKDDSYKTYTFRKKDVGHKEAINQPFKKKKRSFDELVLSTAIMLRIVDMVRKGEETVIFDPKERVKEISNYSF
jgi:predicted dehydrogenase